MFGLGKPRTALGRFLDKHEDINQEWLSKATGISRDGVSDLCNGAKNVEPRETTMLKIVGALRKKGYDVSVDDFWPM